MKFAPLLVIAGVTGLVATAVRFAFQEQRAGTVAFWAWMAVPYLVLAVAAVVRAHRDGTLREMLRPMWGDVTRGVGGAIVLFGATLAFTKLALAGTSREAWLARLYLQLGDPGKLRDNAWAVAGMLISLAILEELVWRGLVTGLLAEVIGSRRAWVWAAVLYALAHLPVMWALRDERAGLNPVLPMAALAAGLVWGGMTRYFGRLPPAIVAHALFDWVVVVQFRLWGQSV
jgi:membrane protease YdiL (CAAX protease family)